MNRILLAGLLVLCALPIQAQRAPQRKHTFAIQGDHFTPDPGTSNQE